MADVFGGGEFYVYPHVEERSLLFLQFRRDSLRLSAGPYVGLIPLTPKVVVDVRPKLPVGNFARVLDVAAQPLEAIAGTHRMYLSEDLSSESVLEFLTRNLLVALRPVLEHGYLKAYRPLSELTSSPRGRIDITGTMARAWARGQHHQVQAQRYEQTSDLAANRLLKFALFIALSKLGSAGDHGRALLREANKVLLEMPSIIGDMKAGDEAQVRSLLNAGTISPARRYYVRALEMALLILSDRGISLQAYGEDVQLETFIVNFETLFEGYLRRVLQLRADAAVVRVRDGNNEAKKPLFDNRKNPPAQPDIVISSTTTGRKIIAEVKYKDSPNREDYNQAITYAVSYRTNRVVIVHQRVPGAPGGLQQVGTLNGISLDTYAYDLGRPDLELEEAAFANCLLGAVA